MSVGGASNKSSKSSSLSYISSSYVSWCLWNRLIYFLAVLREMPSCLLICNLLTPWVYNRNNCLMFNMSILSLAIDIFWLSYSRHGFDFFGGQFALESTDHFPMIKMVNFEGFYNGNLMFIIFFSPYETMTVNSSKKLE